MCGELPFDYLYSLLKLSFLSKLQTIDNILLRFLFGLVNMQCNLVDCIKRQYAIPVAVRSKFYWQQQLWIHFVNKYTDK